ncbi:hypothetical protein SUGI_0900760 [Cryptomeria japonica]|uniref:uncharacterized protein LOC131047066 n=1 Tax=Cryptomeria japonica TaxID=3369 RepID=UPI002414A9D0|nr:uncharacterized protein LOC131047066 [Cryptomeria japonica]GLJ43359.1 hypothetical protein SUGI_0900760 [Cryptomeria japonica]
MAKLNCLLWERACCLGGSGQHNNPKIWACRKLNQVPTGQNHRSNLLKLTVVAATEGSAKSKETADEKIPSWARPDSGETPPWARNEFQKDNEAEKPFQIPFYVYLLSSAIVAIAAVGSIFEYVNQNPIFGVVNPDSVFYAPVLGFFALTGLPTSGFLWYKSIQAANKAAEEQDRKDGY